MRSYDLPRRCHSSKRLLVMLAGLAVLPLHTLAAVARGAEPLSDGSAGKTNGIQQTAASAAKQSVNDAVAVPTANLTYRPVPFSQSEQNAFDVIDQVDFTGDGKSLLIAGHQTGDLSLFGRTPATYWIESWDRATRQKQITAKELAAPFVVGHDGTRVVAMSTETASEGQYAARESEIVVYDSQKQAVTGQLDAVPGFVYGIAMSGEGQSIISAASLYSKKHTRRWTNGHVLCQTLDGEKQWEHNWDTSRVSILECSPDGRSVLGAGNGAFAWNLVSGELVWQQNDHPARVESVAWSVDGSRVATASYCNPGFGFGLVGRLYTDLRIRDSGTGRVIRSVQLYHAGVSRPLDMAFAPDGKSIAVAMGSYNRGQHWGEVRIVDVDSGETLTTLLKDHPQPVTSVAYSPDGQMLAAGSFDGVVRLWNVHSNPRAMLDQLLAEVVGNWLLGDDFMEGLGESIERDLREKLLIESETEWKLVEAVEESWGRVAGDDEHAVVMIHLMLPAESPQKSKTIVLNTSDDAVPFLRLTRSYGLVSSPTAILTIAAPANGGRIRADELLFVWEDDQWVELEADTVLETIE